MNKAQGLEMSRANVIISIFQVIAFIVTFVVFVAFVPWLLSHPMEDLSRYSSAPQPPPNAVNFSVNHGRFTFHTDSPTTNKVKAFGVVSFLFANWAFLVFSTLRNTRNNEGCEESSKHPT